LRDGGVVRCDTYETQRFVDVVSDAIAITSDCALLRTGSVKCWDDRWIPHPIEGIDDAIDVGTNRSGTCAIRRNGTTLCWSGLPPEPQFVPHESSEPLRVPGIDDAIAVATNGASQTCALRSNGELVCWGNDSIQQSRMQGIRSMAGGSGTICAVRREWTVACSGEVDGDRVEVWQAHDVDGITDVVDVSVASNHRCATTVDASTRCWGGDNEWGELGQAGVREGRRGPVPGIGPVRAVRANSSSSGSNRPGPIASACALLQDTSVWCWGGRRTSESTPATPPQPVEGLDRVTALEASGDAGWCALLLDRTVRCWNDLDLDNGRHPTPVPGLNNVASLSVSNGAFPCAVRTNGTVTCWGSHVVVRSDRIIHVALEDVPIPWREVPRLNEVRQVTTGADHACAVTSAGAVWCWGENYGGQLGQPGVRYFTEIPG
jgi:alpha-tubulin suppressor-like RCC1 family protein